MVSCKVYIHKRKGSQIRIWDVASLTALKERLNEFFRKEYTLEYQVGSDWITLESDEEWSLATSTLNEETLNIRVYRKGCEKLTRLLKKRFKEGYGDDTKPSEEYTNNEFGKTCMRKRQCPFCSECGVDADESEVKEGVAEQDNDEEDVSAEDIYVTPKDVEDEHDDEPHVQDESACPFAKARHGKKCKKFGKCHRKMWKKLFKAYLRHSFGPCGHHPHGMWHHGFHGPHHHPHGGLGGFGHFHHHGFHYGFGPQVGPHGFHGGFSHHGHHGHHHGHNGFPHHGHHGFPHHGCHGAFEPMKFHGCHKGIGSPFGHKGFGPCHQ